ncbi:MAG: hypothetical protein HY898_15890 [Deltaproteobacteria bacterium]|nr:hypothetical protein [Deltaproteobacteria bacterium]
MPRWLLISPTARTTPRIAVPGGIGTAHIQANPGKKLVQVDVRVERSGTGVLSVATDQVFLELNHQPLDLSKSTLAGVGLVDTDGTCNLIPVGGGVVASAKVSLSRTGQSIELRKVSSDGPFSVAFGTSASNLCLAFAVPAGHTAPLDLHFDGAVRTVSLDSTGTTPISLTRSTALTPPLDTPMAHAVAPARRRLFDSPFTLGLELGIGAPFGGVMEEEKQATVVAKYSDGTTQSSHPSHTAINFGVNVDAAVIRKHRVKLALRLGYLYSDVKQDASIGDENHEKKSWSGSLLDSHAVLAGPVLYAGLGGQWYGAFSALAGPVFGTLHPAPVARQVSNLKVPDVAFSGWQARIGAGFGYEFSSVLLGGDLTYGVSSINLEQAVYRNLGKTSGYNEVGLGVHTAVFF